ncbi:MAG: DUF6580 family putative transport protein [Candidatus Omnitrophota bacterium]
MLVWILILIGICFRFLPHIPNVTPIAAIALFSSATLSDKRLSIIIPLSLMIVTDLFLGLHETVVFTWGSVVLISLIGLALRKARTTTHILAGSLLSSLVFFIVTNFGVWMAGWYPQTPEGLMACYVAAIPFFRYFLAGTMVYSAVFFGSYALAARLIKGRLESALLK